MFDIKVGTASSLMLGLSVSFDVREREREREKEKVRWGVCISINIITKYKMLLEGTFPTRWNNHENIRADPEPLWLGATWNKNYTFVEMCINGIWNKNIYKHTYIRTDYIKITLLERPALKSSLDFSLQTV